MAPKQGRYMPSVSLATEDPDPASGIFPCAARADPFISHAASFQLGGKWILAVMVPESDGKPRYDAQPPVQL